MPKTTSKKAQKKGAKGGDDVRYAYTERGEDQMWARALRLLGSRNVLLYCNDDRVRIGHVCNRMKFRSWVEVGDIVLISIREFETMDDPKKDTRRADIIAKYTPDHRSTLKKEPGFNLKLIQPLESSGIDLSTVGQNLATRIVNNGDEDDLFEDEESEEDEEDESEDSEGDAKKTKKKLPKKQESKVAAADMENGADDIDIDAI